MFVKKEISLAGYSNNFSQLDIVAIDCVHNVQQRWEYFFLYASIEKYSTLEEFMSACHKYLLVNYEYNDTFENSIDVTFRDDLLESNATVMKVKASDIISSVKSNFDASDLLRIKAELPKSDFAFQYGTGNDEYVIFDDKKYGYLTYYS